MQRGHKNSMNVNYYHDHHWSCLKENKDGMENIKNLTSHQVLSWILSHEDKKKKKSSAKIPKSINFPADEKK